MPVVINLDKVMPYPRADEWFQDFYRDNIEHIRRENKSSAARVQDVLVLAWLDRMGGFVGTPAEYVELLSYRVWQRERREYRTDLKRRRVEADVLWARLMREAEVAGQSIELVIDSAPEQYRQVLEWKFVAGYTDSEIGKLVGKDRSTVTKWMNRAYREMKICYS